MGVSLNAWQRSKIHSDVSFFWEVDGGGTEYVLQTDTPQTSLSYADWKQCPVDWLRTDVLLLLSIQQHSDAIRCQNKLPPLSFQHNLKLLIISRLLLLFFCKEDKRHWEERHSFTLTGKSTLITAAFTMVWRFCRLSPVITISIKCLSVKVILTVGCVSPLVSTHLLCPYKFSTITCQGFFSFFFSKSRNYSCLLSPLSSWHHSSIIQFLIWLFEVCSLVWRQVSLC